MPPLPRLPTITGFQPRSRLEQVSLLLLSGWVLTMISLPIVRWTMGDGALHSGIIAGVAVQIIAVVVTLAGAWGWPRTLKVTLLVTLCAWGSEALGIYTGIPFGRYTYTNSLQPQVLDVPLLIPLAWMMMLPPAWAIASRIAGGEPGRRGWLGFSLLSALAMTAWDLFLDPQMVLWGFWIWEQPGTYFGIPLINFIGWLLVSGLISVWVRPTQLPVRPLLAVYAITWVLESIGQLAFWGLPGPAVFGFLGMGSLCLLALRSRGTDR